MSNEVQAGETTLDYFTRRAEEANARAERLAALLKRAAEFLPDRPSDDVRQEAMEYIERLRAEIDAALAAPKETD